jgi:hypothetical protein
VVFRGDILILTSLGFLKSRWVREVEGVFAVQVGYLDTQLTLFELFGV